MESADMLKLLKEALQDPDMRSALKEMVKDPVPKNPNTKEIKVYEVDEREIPEIEREANKKIVIDKSFRRSERPEVVMITKRCGCGREQKVMAGGPLDTETYICNKCLVR